MSIAGGPDIPSEALIGPNVATMGYVVRTRTPLADLMPMVRAAIAAVDPQLAVAQVRTLEDIVDRASDQMTFTMVLLGTAAVVALVLGAIGIYGVVSYVAAQRTGEIGVRLALGATGERVAWLVVRRTLAIAVPGIAIGLVAAFAVTRVLGKMLFEISPTDPGTYWLVGLLLGGVAVAACLIPARRASRVDPMVALRES